MCRVKADYSQALAAANNAIEVINNSSNQTLAAKVGRLNDLVNFIHQGQCEVS